MKVNNKHEKKGISLKKHICIKWTGQKKNGNKIVLMYAKFIVCPSFETDYHGRFW